MLLEAVGHEVRMAHTGPAALGAARDFRPSAVRQDIGLPGLSGYEVAKRLRAEPGLEMMVLIALTGWGAVEDRRRTAEAGFDHHLAKPAKPAVVLAILAGLSGAGG